MFHAIRAVIAVTALVLVTTPAWAAACHCVLNANVTQATIGATICAANWTDKIRPSSAYTNAIKRRLLGSNASPATMKANELDHCCPLELGGAPADHANLWLQPWVGHCNAREKDRVETGLHRLVCAGRMSLDKARALVTNWCQRDVRRLFWKTGGHRMPHATRHHRAAKRAGRLMTPSGPVDTMPSHKQYEIIDKAHKPDHRGQFAGVEVTITGGKQVVRMTEVQARYHLDNGSIRPVEDSTNGR